MYFVIATDASSVVGTNKIVQTTKSSWEIVNIHRTALLCLLSTTGTTPVGPCLTWNAAYGIVKQLCPVFWNALLCIL